MSADALSGSTRCTLPIWQGGHSKQGIRQSAHLQRFELIPTRRRRKGQLPEGCVVSPLGQCEPGCAAAVRAATQRRPQVLASPPLKVLFQLARHGCECDSSKREVRVQQVTDMSGSRASSRVQDVLPSSGFPSARLLASRCTTSDYTGCARSRWSRCTQHAPAGRVVVGEGLDLHPGEIPSAAPRAAFIAGPLAQNAILFSRLPTQAPPALPGLHPHRTAPTHAKKMAPLFARRAVAATSAPGEISSAACSVSQQHALLPGLAMTPPPSPRPDLHLTMSRPHSPAAVAKPATKPTAMHSKAAGSSWLSALLRKKPPTATPATAAADDFVIRAVLTLEGAGPEPRVSLKLLSTISTTDASAPGGCGGGVRLPLLAIYYCWSASAATSHPQPIYLPSAPLLTSIHLSLFAAAEAASADCTTASTAQPTAAPAASLGATTADAWLSLDMELSPLELLALVNPDAHPPATTSLPRRALAAVVAGMAGALHRLRLPRAASGSRLSCLRASPTRP